MRVVRASLLVATMMIAALDGRQVPAASGCDGLLRQALPNGTITSAAIVAAGQFQPPQPAGRGRGGDANAVNAAAITPFAGLPAFCRVAATLTPSSDSDIRIELWMPVSGWNGKLVSEGNGGWAGVLSYAAMVDPVRRGYAAVST